RSVVAEAGRQAGRAAIGEAVGRGDRGQAVAPERGAGVLDVAGVGDARLHADVHRTGAGGRHRLDVAVVEHGDGRRRRRAEQHLQVASGAGEVDAGDGDDGAGRAAGGAQPGDDRGEADDLEVAEVQALEAVDAVLDVVVVPGHQDAVAGIDEVAG